MTAIYELAFFVTGQQHFYAMGTSTGPSTTSPQLAAALTMWMSPSDGI